MSSLITRTALERRGWTHALAADIELEPDEISETSRGHTIHLYDIDRIARLEQLPQVAARLAATWRRRAARALTIAERYQYWASRGERPA